MSWNARLIPGSPIWLSLPVLDLARSKTFYEKVLGWTFPDPTASKVPTSDPEFYPESKFAMFQYPDNRLHEAGMGGGSLTVISSPEDLAQHEKVKGNMMAVVSWFFVEDVKETLKKVVENGGKKVGDIEEEGKSGYMCHFEDPEGNVLGVYMFRKE
ncbi:MAG: hypothetical protein M1823_001021 [Watsoniomyces obsoletus]|nr:MAG: hypothetical protein M1823_001021 [Watsoniomyces obsoletus]